MTYIYIIYIYIYWWKLIINGGNSFIFDPNDDGGNSSTHQDDFPEVEHISCDTGDWGSQPVDGNFSNHSQDLQNSKTCGFRGKYVMLGKPRHTYRETTTKLLRTAQTASKLQARQMYTLVAGKIMESFERLIWKLSCS